MPSLGSVDEFVATMAFSFKALSVDSRRSLRNSRALFISATTIAASMKGCYPFSNEVEPSHYLRGRRVPFIQCSYARVCVDPEHTDRHVRVGESLTITVLFIGGAAVTAPSTLFRYSDANSETIDGQPSATSIVVNRDLEARHVLQERVEQLQSPRKGSCRNGDVDAFVLAVNGIDKPMLV